MTRPRSEAQDLAAALAEHGIAALIEPLLDIHYLDPPPPELTNVQAILCTSANGVRALARRCGGRGVPLFAVGTASAAQARAEGFACVWSASGNAGDLARLVGERLSPGGGELLHVTGRDTAGDLAGALRARGFAVTQAMLYEARAAAGLSAATVRHFTSRSVDFALFFSPRTAAIFARLASEAGIAGTMAGVSALSISAAADAPLASLPFHTRGVAERPEQAAMLAALGRLAAAWRAA
ncbi:MAG TPA: uroporphyrinogen-III synthase [Stellaceae bacterium]|nr:uroporphyrinogen-III synthase [Stellaceae bacterium]